MKSKLFLFVLSFSLLLFSCKKDKSPEDKLADAKRQIIGTWTVQSSTETFYDANNNIVKTEPSVIGSGFKIQFVDGSTYTLPGSSDLTSNYSVTTVDGKTMITTSDDASYEVTINSNTMKWVVEAGINDIKNVVVKGVTTIQFKKD